MPRAAVLHLRRPEGYLTEKYPSLTIPGYIYSARGKPITMRDRLGAGDSRCWDDAVFSV
jgi:hypothetical protein